MLALISIVRLFFVVIWTLTVCSGIQPEDRPTLPKLVNFKLKDERQSDLLTRIASDYLHFGTLLLNDEDGAVLTTIRQSSHFDPETITREIFRRWFHSDDSITWARLAFYLREANLNTVASDIESMYGVIEDEPHPAHSSMDRPKGANGKHSIKVFRELVKAVSEVGNWEGLCTNLDVDISIMSELRYSTEQVSVKKLRCLQAYFDDGMANWEKVISAVFDPPIRNRRLAKLIAQTQGVDFDRIVKDEL